MKKLLLSLFVALTASFAAQAQNLLKNANMEEWADGLPTAWDPASNKVTNVTVKEAEGRTGKGVEIVESSYNGKPSNARFCQLLDLEPGTYVLSFWAKGSADGQKAVAGHYTVGKSSKDAYTYSKEQVVLSASQWTEVNYEFTISEAGKYGVVLRNDKTSGGSIFVDDASLTLKGGSAIAAPSLQGQATEAFDLSGRRVAPSQKGIVIVGGVKRINR